LPSLLLLAPQDITARLYVVVMTGPSVSFPGFPKHAFQFGLGFKSRNQSL